MPRFFLTEIKIATKWHRMGAIGFGLFEILASREVAREHRLLNELVGVIGPKLTYLRVGLDDRVGEFAVYTCHFTNVNVENRCSVFVETYRSDRAVIKADLGDGLGERPRVRLSFRRLS